ncbi:hypothetical protein F2P81_023011 [Scophthalmus maximus]|uniref:Uncharacterized protein n=1 Tax=Scophthalmus maximus TaxID=52904 RepID=A0A6A4RVA1_SCOMX|nr:hypothetical protein F2P81_023011 [Scophthalmus maximus]
MSSGGMDGWIVVHGEKETWRREEEEEEGEECRAPEHSFCSVVFANCLGSRTSRRRCLRCLCENAGNKSSRIQRFP